MFRDMRRHKQLLSQSKSFEILESATSGVLAVQGDNGYPYTVPLSHVYHDGKLYFHCAQQGHKIDALQTNDKVSFCVIARDHVVPERFSTEYASVVAFGRAFIIEDEQKKRDAIDILARKFSPGENLDDARENEINKTWRQLCLIQMDIQHITGKASMNIIQEI